MKPVTIRLDEGLVDALDAEADDRDVNRTEYVRNILRNREAVRDNTPDNTVEYAETNTREYERTRDNTRENTGEYDALEGRLADLEARVEELEAGGDAIAPTPLSTDTPGDTRTDQPTDPPTDPPSDSPTFDRPDDPPEDVPFGLSTDTADGGRGRGERVSETSIENNVRTLEEAEDFVFDTFER